MKHLRPICCLLLLGFAMQTCQSPLKDVELKFIDPLPTVVELRLVPDGDVLPAPLLISVVGPDADEVVTLLNTRRFRLSNGSRLYLSLTPAAAPTPGNPLRFTIVATAGGMYDMVYPMVLTSRTQRVVSAPLIRNPTMLPVAQISGRSNETGVVQAAMSAQTPALNASATQLMLPVGTLLKDVTGGAVAGTINVQAQQLDIRSAGQLAGNGIVFQPLNTGGQPTPTQQLATIAGGVRLSAFSDTYQSVKSFDKPARLTFTLNPQLINPRTNRAVQPGDVIPLFSYDAAVGRWSLETAGTVVRNARNGLDYIASIDHLSDWVAAFANPICEAGPIFTISSPIPPGNLLYRCQVIDATTNQPLPNSSGTADFYSTVTNGRSIQLYFQPVSTKIKLRVYDSGSNAIVTSAAVESCSTGVMMLDLSSFRPPKNVPVAVKIALQFPCKSLNAAALPTRAIYAQFRETGAAIWQDLPVMRYEPGKTEFSINTYDVVVGKTYDIQAGASPGNYTVSQSAQRLDTNQWIIRVKTKEYCN